MSDRGETSPLIGEQAEPQTQKSRLPAGYKALPVSFLVSWAIAATAASGIFAYAYILCREPTKCEESEKASYASAVALATSIANVCGLLALGPYERLSARTALWLWLGLRGGSVAVLALGVRYKSVAMALGARVLEGLATDNILHFTLNALYARSSDQRHVSKLMGASLALYMAGMAFSPALMGLLRDFRISFAVAVGVFALATVYLACVRLDEPQGSVRLDEDECEGHEAAPVTTTSTGSLREAATAMARPALYFVRDRRLLPHGAAMLCYNAAISYMFPALMVHASLRFGFSSAQNGLIVSVAAATSALYLLATTAFARPSRDWLAALLSLAVLVAALCALGAATTAAAVYPLVAVASLGLATPSFVKAHLVRHRPHDSLAVAALSVAECVGSLLSAPLLGGWQSAHPGGSVLFVAAGLAGASMLAFMVAVRVYR